VHPAYSVIFSTTSSGLGYGLLALLGLMGGTGLIPADRGFGLAAFGLALVTVTLGLLAPAPHLGPPERAGRAFSQWRTSWLSREGIAAIATTLAAGIFALGWIVWGETGGPWALAGIIGAAGALITIACTAMIYASLPTVAAWSNRWTVPAYLALGLATGSLWLAALSRLFAIDWPAITHLPLALVLAAWIVKVLYWGRMDQAPAAATPEPGSGGPEQQVRQPAAPLREDNFVMREMGYDIARRHAIKLRSCAQALAFFVPLALTQLVMFLPAAPPYFAITMALGAAVSGTAGVLMERWLFFAEARQS
jgi:DMSO reductase anchor subunit